MQFERDFESLKVRCLTSGNTEGIQVNFLASWRKSQCFKVLCMFYSVITLKIWFQKRLQWITELFFSFLNENRHSREGERTKKVQHVCCHVPEGSMHRHETCPAGHWAATDSTVLCSGLPSAITPCLTMKSSYISLSLFMLPYISVVLSVIKKAQSTLQMAEQYTVLVEGKLGHRYYMLKLRLQKKVVMIRKVLGLLFLTHL